MTSVAEGGNPLAMLLIGNAVSGGASGAATVFKPTY
jgi:hypothetical protein